MIGLARVLGWSGTQRIGHAATEIAVTRSKLRRTNRQFIGCKIMLCFVLRSGRRWHIIDQDWKIKAVNL